MFGILLIAGQIWLGNQSSQSATPRTASLASVARPEWNHSTPSGTDAVQNEMPWAVPQEAAPFKDGVPPSPAILNSQGWKNVTGVIGSLFAGSVICATEPVDSSNDPKDLSPVTAEVEDLIARWETAAAPSPRLFEFRRITYDLNRQVETRAKGMFEYRSSDKGGFCFTDEALRSEQISERKDPEGNRFVIEPGSSEEWHWSPNELLHLNKTAKTYSIVPLPTATARNPNRLFSETIEARAPFLVNVRKDTICREWKLTLLARVNHQCCLEAIPRTAVGRRNFSRCLILLNSESGRLSAIKYISADQVHETVYMVDRCREITRPTDECIFPSHQPKLKGYARVPMSLR